MFPIFIVLAVAAGLVALHEYAGQAASPAVPGNSLVAGHGYCIHLTLAGTAWTSITAEAAVRAAAVKLGFQEPIAVLVNVDADTNAWTATATGLYGAGPAPLPTALGSGLAVVSHEEVTLPAKSA